MKTTRLIGSRCKHSDVLSQRVLIGRGLDLEKNRDVESKISSLSERLLFGFEDTLESIFEKAVLKKGNAAKTVSMAVRIHLFPSRTQKLSSLASKILGWRRPGKIDRRRHKKMFEALASGLQIFLY